MTPTSRLAALVTSSASAPISCISLGNERQSTELRLGGRFRQRDGITTDEIKRLVCLARQLSCRRADPTPEDSSRVL